MASDQGRIEQGVASNGDVRPQAESPKVHTALVRQLKNRHVAMIRYISLLTAPPPRLTLASSIGSVIGTGLFFGIAPSLMNGGPLGLLLGYVFIATICFAMMVPSCLHRSQARIALPLITALSWRNYCFLTRPWRLH